MALGTFTAITLEVIMRCFLNSASLVAGIIALSAEISFANEWSGAYVGVHAGSAWQDHAFGLGTAYPLAQNLFNNQSLPNDISLRDTAFSGGVVAGYSWQSGALVAGIETDFSAFSGGGDTQSVQRAPSASIFTTQASAQVQDLVTIRGRVGWLIAPQTLLFATGGLALGHTSVSTGATEVHDPACASFCFNGSSSKWSAGWVVGGGADYALDSHWSLRGEFLHYDLGSVKFSMAIPPPHDDYVFSSRTNFSGDIGRAALVYKF